jgi:hypothetical protein
MEDLEGSGLGRKLVVLRCLPPQNDTSKEGVCYYLSSGGANKVHS